MPFPYNHVLLIGATAGIGLALADRLANAGVKITVVGRRQDRLDDFVRRHGESKAQAVKFDIGEKEKIPGFATDVLAKYPDIDCIFLNAGFQRQENFSRPETVDLKVFHEQVHVNFLSFVDLTHAFLPILMKRESKSSIIYTTSNLSIIPAVAMPAYSASKAALNSFVLCLREHVKKSPVKIIEVSPPAVQTELHDYMGEEIGRSVGMPLDAFINETYARLEAGQEEIIVVGSVGPQETFREVVEKRLVAFRELTSVFLPRILGGQ